MSDRAPQTLQDVNRLLLETHTSDQQALAELLVWMQSFTVPADAEGVRQVPFLTVEEHVRFLALVGRMHWRHHLAHTLLQAPLTADADTILREPIDPTGDEPR